MTAPIALASGATPGGLPYPTIDDHLAQTDRFIADLADAVAVRLANPGVVTYRGDVTTDGNGDALLRFTALRVLQGVIVQVNTGGGTYAFYPSIVGLNGDNSAIARFRKAAIATYSSAITPYTGTLNINAYAWGTV